ncbi:MAG: hypothetical protein ABIK09_10510 [Pseudomonadota bacterium]
MDALRRTTLVVVTLNLLLAACASPTSITPISQAQPVAATYTCQAQTGAGLWEAVPLSECAADAGNHRLLAWVANGYTGDVGIIDLTRGRPVDVNVQIPGYTRIRLGTWLSDIVALPDGSRIYATDPVERTLVGLDTVTLEETGTIHLPGSPLQVVLAAGAEPPLWVLTADPPGLIPVDPETGAEDGLHLDGVPSDAAWDPVNGHLIVGYKSLQYVSVIDLASRTELAPIGLLDACADGLDNDHDGFADAADPDCSGATDDDESTPGEALETGACGNGVDDDGDGLADAADPGCVDALDNSESEDAPVPEEVGQTLAAWTLTCANGLDDDDDGLADDDDPDCAADPRGPEAAWFACSDGLDNDGDGLTDWPEEPHCYRASDPSEAGPAAPMARVAVTSDGRFAYVGHVGLGQVLVLDLEAGRRLDLSSSSDLPSGDPDPIDAIHDVPGFAVTGTILDLVDVPGVDWEDMILATSDGRLTAIRALIGGEPVHTLSIVEQDPSSDLSQAFKPSLQANGEEIELGFTPSPRYPNLGPLAVIALDEVGEVKQYYGIRFSARTDWHRTEVWTITWEGILPGGGGMRARLRDPGRLDLPGAGLCGIGVQPGDLAVIRFDDPLACGAYLGKEFEFLIEDAGPDWLMLDKDAGGRQIADVPETELERDDDEWISEWDEAVVDMPDAACFQGVLKVDVRVADQFVVRGSRTGFLHPVIDSVEGCVLDADADPLFTGRAVPATVLSTDGLFECPITELTGGIEANTFVNSIFEVDIFPPCTLSEEGTVSIIDIDRDVRWSFTVASGFDLRDLIIGGLPTNLNFLSGPDQVYLLDPATHSVKTIEPFDEDGLFVDDVFL